jgi:dUTP pyrophosphatase
MLVHSLDTILNVEKIKKDHIQPNAVDITIEQLFQMGPENTVLRNSSCEVRSSKEILPTENFWTLYPGCTYQFLSDLEVYVHEGRAGWLIPRSTLVRNGIQVFSGLYDSGFRGKIGGVITTFGNKVVIERGFRVAQFVTVRAESKYMYKGQYQNT